MSSRVQVKIDWDAIAADPVEFCKKILKQPDGSPFVPHPAQETIMRGIKRNTVAVTGRQFGKSLTFEAHPIWFGCTHPNRTIMIMAPTLDQARIIFNGIVRHFRDNPLLKTRIVGKIKNSPFPELTISNGTRFMARGLNSPEYVRGNRVHYGVIDEAAFVKDGVIRETVEPMFLSTGKEPDSALILVSTPFGNGEFKDFWDTATARVEAKSPRFAQFHYTSFDNPYNDIEQLLEVRDRYGENSPIWQAEYLGNFQDDELAIISTADIKAATLRWTAHQFPVAPIEGHRYIQGVDLANQRDYFVSTCWDVTDKDAVTLVRIDRYRKRGYSYYKGVVRGNYRLYNRARTILDATTVAESVVEDLADISPVGYKIGSNQAKYEIVHELARLFSEGRIVLPPDQKEALYEYTNMRYKPTASGTLQMEAPKGQHDDIFMSSALAAHLAVIPSMVGSFLSVDLSPRKPVPAGRRNRDDIPDFWEGCFD